MRLILSLTLVLLLNNFLFAKDISTQTDTTKPVKITAKSNLAAELNVLVVLNGKIAGTIGQIKSIESIVPLENIKSLNVLKDSAAINKYGEKGKWGVIEITATGTMKISDISIKEVKEEDDDDKVFVKVEVEASFPGGVASWRKYLEGTTNAAVGVDNGAPIGNYTTIVQFIVDKEGNISDVKPLTNFGYGMEDEVVRIIKTGPKWYPAVQSGRAVKAYRKQPVTFLVDDEEIEVQVKEMYVFYTGISNSVSIKVYKMKDEELDITISQGTIVSIGDGDYEVRVDNPGKAIITINNKKTNKEIGRVYFAVK